MPLQNHPLILSVETATLGGSVCLAREAAVVSYSVGEPERTVALLPAGRGEVFAQMFSVSPQGHVTELDAIAHVAPAAMLEKYAAIPDIRWCGEGAHMYADSIAQCAAREGH